MTADEFRELALNLPEAIESEHMRHPDFRVGGKIFATLGAPNATFGMVRLTPDQQKQYLALQPRAFVPVNGNWGKQGCTHVVLEFATRETVWEALVEAWRNIAPKKLSTDF